MNIRFSALQPLGRALMLPIAVLPIAGLLLRLGQPDLLGWTVMAAAGSAIFSNLGLLFAVGVAVGLARENHGAAGLAALDGAGGMPRSHLWHAARADALERLGRADEARRELGVAAALAPTGPEQRLLARRLDALVSRGADGPLRGTPG